MNNMIKCAKLDFLIIKPYLTTKNLAIFLGVMLFNFLMNGDIFFAAGMLAVYSGIYLSYTFVVSEQHSVDVFYHALPLRGIQEVVRGRYLFSVFLQLASLLLSATFYIVVTLFNRTTEGWWLLVGLLLINVGFYLITLVQLPVYFKVGYTKGKVATYIPLIFVAGVVGFVVNSQSGAPAVAGLLRLVSAIRLPVLVLVCATFYLLAIAISYRLSVRFYSAREF